MPISLVLKSPLFTAWSEQYLRLYLPAVTPGTPLALSVDGQPAPFQYTGTSSARGAEVLVRLAFAKDQTRTLTWSPVAASSTDLTRVDLPLAQGASLAGAAGADLRIPAPAVDGQFVAGPFAGFGPHPWLSRMRCTTKLEAVTLTRVNAGPLFTEYELRYAFAQQRFYQLTIRSYQTEAWYEIAERLALGMDAALEWTLNPAGDFDRILSHRGPEFEGEAQPVIEALGQERPADVLCRLQMPVLSEYFIPNNRGWLALFNDAHRERGMVGIMGLYGARWQRPVENMPIVRERGGSVVWSASLNSGARYWLLTASPFESAYTPTHRFFFHRLHAEFNALRLDEHLDLTGDTVYDASAWQRDAFFAGADYHEQARARLAALPALQRITGGKIDTWMQNNGGSHLATFAALLDPTPAKQQAVYDHLLARFTLWVEQFQGYRRAQPDYMKNVIGFTRWLRGMLIAYEMLRKDGVLTPAQVGTLNAYFVFAARRILDEGRWPHSHTWQHPDHPESTRDFYRYGGEHRPDRLVWTNCLPNFQSDPLAALAHLSALFPDHPDAQYWQRFALDDIDRQLSAYAGESGAWVESINYALYTLSYLIISFRPLKYRAGLDYFNDERVRRYVTWLCNFYGPKDKRVDQHTWPGIGNAVIPSGGGVYLLAYAGELAPDDPLRAACLAIYQSTAATATVSEHYPNVLAAMAPLDTRAYPLPCPASMVMDEVGVALRGATGTPQETYLFQKIGFAKDHYEGDESAFNWYAKGTPLCMDYATYTGEVGTFGAHNLVEVAEEDALRRGYLAEHLFSNVVDYTRCELPVTQKLLYGRVRSFAEIEGSDGIVSRETTPYFYIGDENPVGPKVWKTRLLLLVKPDYVVLFDRVYGDVPHRYNLHAVAGPWQQQGQTLRAEGRFDLDPVCFVHSPAQFDLATGELVPTRGNELHRQHFFRLTNRQHDGIYRTLIFAQERGRAVQLSAASPYGIKVVTPEYTDYVFLHNEWIQTTVDGISFTGRSGWLRRSASGQVSAAVPDGDQLAGFGLRLTGRGPWTFNVDSAGAITLKGGPPRTVKVERG